MIWYKKKVIKNVMLYARTTTDVPLYNSVN